MVDTLNTLFQVLNSLDIPVEGGIHYTIERGENGDIILRAPKQNTKEEQAEVNAFYDSLAEIDVEVFKSAVKNMLVGHKESFDLLADKDPKGVDIEKFRKAVTEFRDDLKDAAEAKIVEIEDKIDTLYEEINTLKATYMK